MAERIAVDSLLSAGGLARPENSRAAAERAARERRAPAEATYGLRGALDGQAPTPAQGSRSGAAQAVSLLRPSAASAGRAEALPVHALASTEGASRFGLRPAGRDEADVDGKAVVVRRAQRRKSGSQTFTWQRFAVLALVVAVAGGAGIALQSLASRNDDMAETGPASGQLVASNVVNSGDLAQAQQPPVRQAAPYTPLPQGAATPASPATSSVAAAPPAAAPAVAAPPVATPTQAVADAEPPIGRAGADAAVEDTGASGAGDSGDGASLATLPQTAPLPKQKPKIVALTPPAPRPSTAAAFAAPTSIAANTPVANAEPAEPDAADAADDNASAAPASGGASSGPGTVRRTVTVRAAPGGASIGVLRPGQKVSVVSCDSWCRIEFDGKTGYIFKSFVSVGG